MIASQSSTHFILWINSSCDQEHNTAPSHNLAFVNKCARTSVDEICTLEEILKSFNLLCKFVRGVQVMFWKIDINWSAVGISICLTYA